MTAFLAGAAALMIMGALRHATRPPRRPFTLAPAWRTAPGVGRHRAAPDPGRDWTVW
jgi:hypothetical protein